MSGALEILKRERDGATEQIRLLRAKIRDLDAAIGVLEGQPVAATSRRASGDLKSSVLKKLEEAGETGGSPKELADSLTQSGRPTSDASVSSTLSRLKGEAKVANRNGRWFIANLNQGETIDVSPSWDIPSSQTDWNDDEPPF
jgi:hypothetical protein